MNAGNHQLLVCWQTLQHISQEHWKLYLTNSAQKSGVLCLSCPRVPTPCVPSSLSPHVSASSSPRVLMSRVLASPSLRVPTLQVPTTPSHYKSQPTYNRSIRELSSGVLRLINYENLKPLCMSIIVNWAFWWLFGEKPSILCGQNEALKWSI